MPCIVIKSVASLFRYLGNIDDTPVFFDMVPGETIDVRGKKTIKVRMTGSEKRHITVVLVCVASGEFLPLDDYLQGENRLP